MKNILDKKTLFKLNENLNFKNTDSIFIHHPITQDVVTVNIKKIGTDKLLVSIPENSVYYGQPDFYIKKIFVIGIKQN